MMGQDTLQAKRWSLARVCQEAEAEVLEQPREATIPLLPGDATRQEHVLVRIVVNIPSCHSKDRNISTLDLWMGMPKSSKQ